MSSLVLSGDTSGTVSLSVPAVAGTNTLTIQAGTGTNSMNTLATAVASTSGTSIDFTSIPSWVKKITVMLAGLSTNGSSGILVRIGDSGGVAATGYVGGGSRLGTATESVTTGFAYADPTGMNAAAAIWTVLGTISLLGSNQYVWSANTVRTDSILMGMGVGYKTLTGVLTTVRLTTVNGTDTFDAGSVNILYEG